MDDLAILNHQNIDNSINNTLEIPLTINLQQFSFVFAIFFAFVVIHSVILQVYINVK